MAIEDEIDKLKATKQALKEAMIEKGMEVSDADPFDTYPDKIKQSKIDDGRLKLFNGQKLAYLRTITTEDLERVENADVSEVADGSYMLANSTILGNLDLTKWDTSKVTNMGGMFGGCENLVQVDLSSFDTSKVTNMGGMFGGCENLVQVDLSSFDTSKVTNMGGMFSGCENLATLDLSAFDTSRVTDMSYMFSQANKKRLILTGWNLINVTNFNSCFDYYCDILEVIGPIYNLNASIGFHKGANNRFSRETAMVFINALLPTETVKRITFHKDVVAKLTDEDKAIVAERGWTLVSGG